MQLKQQINCPVYIPKVVTLRIHSQFCTGSHSNLSVLFPCFHTCCDETLPSPASTKILLNFTVFMQAYLS